MEPKVIRSGTYTPLEDDDSSGFKTRYFPDGSAIIVTEKTVCFLGRVAKYEVRPCGKEPE
jgi:hypothetical protein